MATFQGIVQDGRILLKVGIGKAISGLSQHRSLLPFDALVDTGATATGISPKVVERLDLEPHTWGEVQGISGSTEVDVCRVNIQLPISERVVEEDQVSVLTTTRGNEAMDVSILDLGPHGPDVLLGMDFLREFHLTIYRDLFIISN